MRPLVVEVKKMWPPNGLHGVFIHTDKMNIINPKSYILETKTSLLEKSADPSPRDFFTFKSFNKKSRSLTDLWKATKEELSTRLAVVQKVFESSKTKCLSLVYKEGNQLMNLEYTLWCTFRNKLRKIVLKHGARSCLNLILK
jgi:hypothetical protein